MPEPIPFTYELLEEIARMPKRKQKLVLAELYEQEWQRCSDDPVYWLDSRAHAIPYVYTWDPHDLYRCSICDTDELSVSVYKIAMHLELKHGLTPKNDAAVRAYYSVYPKIRPFTVKEYMPAIIKYWRESQLFAVEKSRDMMLTHLMIALICWDAFFHEGIQWAVQSEDGKKTLDIMENRIKFIHDNMPPWMRKRHPIRWSAAQSKAGHIKLPSLNSEIIGFPQGPDQVRYLHPTGVFVDEAAFQSEAGAGFSACKPAIEHGGKYVAISTPYPSFFQLVCEDRTTEAGARSAPTSI